MFITWTERAKQEVEKRVATNKEILRLVYETEGCGCAVSGVTALYIETSNQLQDIQAESNTDISIFFNPQHQVFLAEELTIDFSEKANSFQLKTPNEMLNPRMRLVKK